MEDKIHYAVPDIHGSNLELKDIPAGNRVYLPLLKGGD